MKKALLTLAFVSLGFGQDTPLDTRLTVHTLVREDMFAGFMAGNVERMTRGEQTLDRLMKERQIGRASCRERV